MRPGGLALLLWSSLATCALAQDLVIEHSGFGCVVAEKYPQLSACITPRSRVARARVYFRSEGTSDWYFVPLNSFMPCYRAVLPKPNRNLRRFSYYLGATDSAFAETQTPEYEVEVVPDEASCRKGPLAPFLNNASVVASSAAGTSALPLGFSAGGAGFPGLVLGVVGGGAAVVGGIAAIGGGSPPSSPGPTTPAAGTGPGSLPPRPPTTTAGPSPTSTAPASPTTTAPGSPATTVPPTTTVPGMPTTTVPGTPTTTAPSAPSTTLPMTTTTTLNACAGDTTPPQVKILYPTGGLPLPLPSVVINASASDADGIAKVDFYYQESGHGAVFIGSSSSPPYSVLWLFPPCSAALFDTYAVSAVATDNCGNVATSSVNVTLIGLPLCLLSTPAPHSSWVNELSVPGGRGQVVLNGTDAFFPGEGRSTAGALLRSGLNRVEALLVDGRGQGGTWRFELNGLGLEEDSLRVLAGEVVLATTDSVVFRLRGQPGERVVFSFRRHDR